MDVVVDGKAPYSFAQEPEDALDAVRVVSDAIARDGRAIVAMRVDGEEVDPGQLPASLDGRALSDIERLEVDTEEINALVSRCLEEVADVLPELPNACRNLAMVFHSNAPGQGYDSFDELAQIWSRIKTREILAANALNVSFDDLVIDGVPLARVHAELNGFLKEAGQAIQDGDTVTLGDLLEYELAPRAEQEAQIVRLLQEHQSKLSA